MDMDKTTTSQSDNHDQNHHLHALDISLIRSLIAADLSKRDLGICLLVCKKWFLDFTPLYWRTIIVQPHRITSYPASIISKYGQHIRVLKAGRIEETSVFNQPSINHLQHLDLSTCGSKDKEDGGRGCLLEIITRNRKGLMSLVWRCFGRDTTMERPFRLWPAMFQGLSELVELDLSNWSLSRVDFLRMLIACPSLRKLTFQAIEDIQESVRRQNPRSGLHSTDESIEMVGTTATGPVSTQDTSQNQSTNSNNRKTPPHDDEHLLGFQHTVLDILVFVGELIPSFLQHVPNITQLAINSIMQGDFKDIDEQVTAKNSLTKVNHLTLLTECSAPLRYLSTAMAIPTLVYFEGMVPFSILDDFLELILRAHSQTIETLLLRDHNPLHNQRQPGFQFNIWRFFETCPQLVNLEIPYSLKNCVGLVVVNTNESHQSSHSNNANNSYIYTHQLTAPANGPLLTQGIPHYSEATLELKLYEPSREWVCKDLRRLHLHIADMDQTRSMQQIPFDLCVDRLLPPEQKRDNSRRTRSVLERMILERLSGLEKLEALNIGVGGWYTLSARKT